MRLGQRFIARETIIQAAENYEIVEEYPDDKQEPTKKSREVSAYVPPPDSLSVFQFVQSTASLDCSKVDP
jgi:hypothetical protein